MARPLRIEFPGGLYHVTSRGDRREAIFRFARGLALEQLPGHVGPHCATALVACALVDVE